MKETIKYLDEHELRRFFQVLKSEGKVRDLLLFTWMYRYGLRVSEAVGLKLENLKPNPTYPTEILIQRLKGGVSRHYPINGEDTKILSRWLKKRAEMESAENNPYLFITRRSGLYRITTDTISKLMDNYGRASGLSEEKRHPHTLRHSSAISLLLNGKDINFVKTWLGHKSIQTTLIYSQFAPPQWKTMAQDAIQNGFFI
ncbi:MAG: tyrosine-type recombinase/integrase [Nitrospirota bacterium]|nr:tyrosine-type recombinase/integrase [Candidatus Aminicenantes bacterium]MDH5203372.1 tyrosine-type recombinase/integrase [Nitrospirota bacterium]MDH5769261.1 tyrosine-type recombinase/integrase [Nitrospirota bacterium]